MRVRLVGCVGAAAGLSGVAQVFGSAPARPVALTWAGIRYARAMHLDLSVTHCGSNLLSSVRIVPGIRCERDPWRSRSEKSFLH